MEYKLSEVINKFIKLKIEDIVFFLYNKKKMLNAKVTNILIFPYIIELNSFLFILPLYNDNPVRRAGYIFLLNLIHQNMKSVKSRD